MKNASTNNRILTSHLSVHDADALGRIMDLQQAPLSTEVRARLRSDLNDVLACGRRKGLDIDRMTLRRESVIGERHFELGCWLHFYSTKLSQGVWARIDCVRRLLLSAYEPFSPSYDFFTVFDFGERQFDNCFEMGDAEQVMQAIASLRHVPHVGQKFAQAGWTDEYLLSRGLVLDAATSAPPVAASASGVQAALFA